MTLHLSLLIFILLGTFVGISGNDTAGLKPFNAAGELVLEDILQARGIISPHYKLEEVPSTRAMGFSFFEPYLKMFKSIFTGAVLYSTYKNFTEKFFKPLDLSRKGTFLNNLVAIFEHNFNAGINKALYHKGLNLFSDMTADEVRDTYTGGMGRVEDSMEVRTMWKTKKPTVLPPSIGQEGRAMGVAAPTEKDWRLAGIVTPPKFQGQCKSCTFFALTGALESAMALYKGTRNLDLSEQQLLDCSNGTGIFRCNGNWPEDVYNYQITNGQGAEATYPYTGTARTCNPTAADGRMSIAKLQNFFKVPPEDENTMKEWVGTFGVATAVIQVDDSLISYHSGIYNTPCDNTRFDHSILVVGYGRDYTSSQDFWIIKNSWGTDWGEAGFFRLARNAANICRIASYAFLPQA